MKSLYTEKHWKRVLVHIRNVTKQSLLVLSGKIRITMHLTFRAEGGANWPRANVTFSIWNQKTKKKKNAETQAAGNENRHKFALWAFS